MKFILQAIDGRIANFEGLSNPLIPVYTMMKKFTQSSASFVREGFDRREQEHMQGAQEASARAHKLSGAHSSSREHARASNSHPTAAGLDLPPTQPAGTSTHAETNVKCGPPWGHRVLLAAWMLTLVRFVVLPHVSATAFEVLQYICNAKRAACHLASRMH